MPAEGRRRRKERKNNCSSMKWKDPQRLQLCSWESTRQPPRDPAALASCTSTRRHVAPEQDTPHAAARASVSPPLPGSGATGRLLSEQLNAGWPTSPSAS